MPVGRRGPFQQFGYLENSRVIAGEATPAESGKGPGGKTMRKVRVPRATDGPLVISAWCNGNTTLSKRVNEGPIPSVDAVGIVGKLTKETLSRMGH